MVEISNETLCMMVVVFIIILILLNMGSSKYNEQRTPCGMKISSKFQNPNDPVLYLNNAPYGRPSGYSVLLSQNNPISGVPGSNLQNNPGVAVPQPRTSFAEPMFNENNPIAGNVGSSGGGDDFFGNIKGNVDKGRTTFIYPPDMQGDIKYIPDFGIDKGQNGVSGLPHDNALPVYGSPFSMNFAPSLSLTKN
jgi:hypothetical protein